MPGGMQPEQVLP